MHKIPLPLCALLAAAPLAAQIDQAMLDEVKAEVVPAVSKATGVDLGKLVIRIAERRELRDVLEAEQAITAKAMGQSESQSRVIARALSRMVLGKFILATKEVLVCPKNFAWQAKAVKTPALNELGAFRAVVVHECVHAADEKRWGWSKKFAAAKTAAQVSAMMAVIEGHAQRVTGMICKDKGWEKGFATYNSVIGKTSPDADAGMKLIEQLFAANLLAAYTDGRRFMDFLAKKEGDKGIARAFEQPPKDFEEVLNPEWYLDPSKRPKNIYKFGEPLKYFAKQHPADEWSQRPVTLSGPQIRATMTLLEKKDVDRILANLKQNRLMVLQDKENPNDRMAVAGLYEFSSPQEARFYALAAERLSRIKDEKMKTGQIKILDTEYTEIREPGVRGQLVLKTVGFAGQRIPVTSVIAYRGAVGVELLYSNEKVETDVVKRYASALLELSLAGTKKAPAKNWSGNAKEEKKTKKKDGR